MSDFEQREAAIEARRLLLAGLIDALPDPVLVVDAGTRILAANDPAREIFAAVREGGALALAVRSPGVLDAVARVVGGELRRVCFATGFLVRHIQLPFSDSDSNWN